jgi:hypothetical protein
VPVGPDQWIADDAISTCGGDAAQQLAAIKAATFVIEGLAGYQFGLRTVTVRPAIGVGCGCVSPGAHGCADYTRVRLPDEYVTVTEVKVDGAVVAPGSYAVFNGNLLVRTDGLTWPVSQSLATPNGQAGTWQVTYTAGVAPDANAQEAVRALACQMVKATVGSGDCALPANVTSVVREGISLQLSDPTAMLEAIRAGGTGLPSVDQWLGVVNPYGLTSGPQVYNPDDLMAGRLNT